MQFGQFLVHFRVLYDIRDISPITNVQLTFIIIIVFVQLKYFIKHKMFDVILVTGYGSYISWIIYLHQYVDKIIISKICNHHSVMYI